MAHNLITQVQRPVIRGAHHANQGEEEDLEEVVISVPNQRPLGLASQLTAMPNKQQNNNMNNQINNNNVDTPTPSFWGKLFSCFGCCQPKPIQEGPSRLRGLPPPQQQVPAPTPAPMGGHTSSHIPPPYNGPYLLGPMTAQDRGKKTLVLDLDETLVHSSFKPVSNADFIIPVEIESEVHKVYVLKRPGVDRFMKECGEKFEVVIFTASLAKYADPLLDQLDIHKVVAHRLFREACVHHCGNYVKDLSRLGRDMRNIIIVDNSPHSYAFQPYNAAAIDTWFDDMSDRQLDDLMSFLNELVDIEDVSTVLDATKGRQF